VKGLWGSEQENPERRGGVVESARWFGIKEKGGGGRCKSPEPGGGRKGVRRGKELVGRADRLREESQGGGERKSLRRRKGRET